MSSLRAACEDGDRRACAPPPPPPVRPARGSVSPFSSKRSHLLAHEYIAKHRLWICDMRITKRRAGFASAPSASSAPLLSILRPQGGWLDRLSIHYCRQH